jgi:hypothetical protein
MQIAGKDVPLLLVGRAELGLLTVPLFHRLSYAIDYFLFPFECLLHPLNHAILAIQGQMFVKGEKMPTRRVL